MSLRNKEQQMIAEETPRKGQGVSPNQQIDVRKLG